MGELDGGTTLDGGTDRGAARDGACEQSRMGAGAAPPCWRRPRQAGALPTACGPAQLRWRRRATFFEIQRRSV